MLRVAGVFCIFLALTGSVCFANGPKKIVLIAGKKSHGPEGNGIHDYPWSVKLLKVMLDNSNVAEQVRVEYHLNGFPKDPTTLNDADSILVISDGRDGDLYEEAPHFASPENLALIQRQVQRGGGFAVIHFSTFGPDRYAAQSFEWTGGYFDWEEEGKRKWYSAIETRDAEVTLAAAEHPVLRGVKPFKLKEEFYFNLRFAPEDKTVIPLWRVAELPGREDRGNVVAWAKERPGGGRGFGTTCGHFFANWEREEFRTLILNALVWTAGIDPPQEGVKAKYYSRAEICAALSGVDGLNPAAAKEDSIRVLLLAGNEAHAWHNWKKTTPLIQALLELDPRIKVDVSNDPEDLGKESLSQYHVIVQNYCNWQDGKPLSDRARIGFADFVSKGGGLVLVHFSNGAWNFSLPMAGDSDWPEYRKIVRRVWNHAGAGESKSGHDAFGKFRVTPTKVNHEITGGISAFEIEDELYYRQDGAEPVEALITAFSKDTAREEELAWTYRYGEGQVFQTLLGHSEKTYEAFGAREMLRRAVAWCAKKQPLLLEESLEAQLLPPKTPEIPKADAAPRERERLVEGRFGKALNAAAAGILAPADTSLRDAPLTVDAWVKLESKDGFNILVASEEKSSMSHWELYSYAGSGVLSAYLPGRGGEFKSDVPITDGRWRHIGMQLHRDRVGLFVDGKKVLDAPLKGDFAASTSGQVAVGRLVEGGLGCDGAIDELRIRRGIHDLTKPYSDPASSDDATVLLWRFDELKDGQLSGASPAKGQEPSAAPAAEESKQAAALPTPKEGHWSHQGVGFGWQESDSADDRWRLTNHGRRLASILPLANGTIAKGLTIRLGPEREMCAAYDTRSATLRAVWTGGFLQFDPARYGIIAPPRPKGTMQFENGADVCWGDVTGKPAQVSHRSFNIQGERAQLEFEVAGTIVRETPWTTSSDDGTVGLLREVEIEPHDARLVIWLTDQGTAVQSVNEVKIQLRSPGAAERTIIARGEGIALTRTMKAEREMLGVMIPASRSRQQLRIAYGFGGSPRFDRRESAATPAKRVYRTKGVRGNDDAALVLDRIGVPFDNPNNDLFFITGHDFIAPGKLALSTLHGDVWIVEGVDDDLHEITWTLFATGLFQPLGLKIRDGQIYVLGRDQITCLKDLDNDLVADRYECFCNEWNTPTGGHDYATCLESDSSGAFYFLDAVAGLQKVAPDGSAIETIATGLRNPNGLGISPRNELTVAPQEGEWTPASFIGVARLGDHFGYLGPKVSADRPLGFTRPLLYLSRRMDNSCGGQVWIPEGAWGPLAGRMLHLSFGQCRMLLIHQEQVNDVAQAGAISLPHDFDSGAMRGRFSPFDGALYVSGSRGWVTRAAQDGCLTRVRYTGKPIEEAPTEVESRGDGFILHFDVPLDRQTACDPGSYRVEAWNYHYSAAYGSRDFKVSRDSEEGRDELEVTAVELSADGKTLYLHTPPLQAANQVQIEYRFRTASGKPLRQTYLHTLHSVSKELLPNAAPHDALNGTGLAKTDLKNMGTGLGWVFESGGKKDFAVRRMAALTVEPGEPPTSALGAGPFTATAQGWLSAPFSDEYAFEIQGSGSLKLRIGSAEVWSGKLVEGAPVRIENVWLRKGYNPFVVSVVSQVDGAARFRILWKGEGFPWEPLPPTSLWIRGQADPASRWKDGFLIAAERQCSACHTVSPVEPSSRELLNQWFAAPSLTEASSRLRAPWLASWIADPEAMRQHARMPKLLKDDATGEADAADLAAFLLSHPPRDTEELVEFSEDQASAGGRLFETLGCLSCHQFTPPAAADASGRVTLHFVGTKYTSRGLVDFLKNPAEHAPASRMPDFKLSEDEAACLAAYLVAQTAANTIAEPSKNIGDATRGKSRFRELGCANCHARGDVTPRERTKIVNWDRGCLSPVPAGPVRFGLSESKTDVVRSFLKSEPQSIHLHSKTDNLSLLMKTYRCNACHDRDLAVAPRRAIIDDEGDSGQPAPPIPNLTWTGDKLRGEWLANFLAGEIATPNRPWLPARMPCFPMIATPLAQGIAAEHGQRYPVASSKSAADRKRAELGAALAAENQLDCRQCHAIGPLAPRGDEKSQIALGINFALTRDRLHPDFFQRFVLDPARYDVGTRMPKLAEGGRTRAVGILNGDAEPQFDALWQFIRSIPENTPK